SANPRNIGLNDRTRPALQILPEMQDAIDAFSNCDRDRRGIREPYVAVDIVGRQRLLDPGDIEWLVEPSAAQGLVHGERLIGVGKNLEIVSHCVTKCGDAGDIFVRRAPNLEFGSTKAPLFGCDCIFYQSRSFQVKPAALRGVNGYGALRTTREFVKRKVCTAAAKIPQSDIDRRHGDGGYRADGGGVGGEEHGAPDGFDLVRVPSYQQRRERVLDQRHDAPATGAYGVAVAASDSSL